MANLGMVFDAAAVEPNTTRDAIPAGKYLGQIIASEMKATRDGSGQYLELEIEILDGACQGRKLWDRLNLANPNATAVEIANRTLSSICHAIGQMQVSDSEQLHFKQMIVAVKVRPAGPDRNGVHRDASNEIGGYAPVSSARQGMMATPNHYPPATSVTAPAATPSSPGKPWSVPRRTA